MAATLGSARPRHKDSLVIIPSTMEIWERVLAVAPSIGFTLPQMAVGIQSHLPAAMAWLLLPIRQVELPSKFLRASITRLQVNAPIISLRFLGRAMSASAQRARSTPLT